MDTNSLLSRLSRHSTVVLLLTLMLVLVRPEILAFFSTRYLGGAVGDPGLYVWLVESFVSDPLRALRYESQAMYPYPKTIAWSDNFFLPSALVYLLTKLGLTTIQGYNLVVCVALVLNGYASFLVARFLNLPLLISVCAGISVELSSVVIGNLGHPQLLYFFWIPLSLLAWCVEGPKKSWLLLSGLSVSGAFYCSVYYSIFSAVGIVALLPFTLSRWWKLLNLSTLGLSLLLFLIGITPILPSILPYMQVRAAFGARHLFEPSYFAATGASYLSFPSLNLLYGESSGWSHGEALLCPGYSILLTILIAAILIPFRRGTLKLYILPLSALGLGISSTVASAPSTIPELLVCFFSWMLFASTLTLPWRSSPRVSSLLFISLVFFLLSFGPGGNSAKQEPSWGVFTPFFYYFPGFESIRASGRFGIASVGLCIPLVFLSLCSLLKRDAQRIQKIVLPLCLTTTILTENFIRHIPIDSPKTPPPIFSTLQSIAKEGEVSITLPFSSIPTSSSSFSWGNFAALHTQYMLWSLSTSVPLVNGYSGQRSRLQEDLIGGLNDFPSSQSVAVLKRICGLRYVVVISSLMPSWNKEEFLKSVSDLASPLSLEAEDSQGNLLLKIPQSRETAPPTSPFFIPTDYPVAFEVTSSLSSESCKGVFERWVKSDHAVIKKNIQEITLSRSPTTLHIQIPPLFPALPGVVSIRGDGCEVEVACSIQ